MYLSLVLVGAVVATGCGDDGASDVPPDATPPGHLALAGACAQPLAADGAVEFAATVVNVQTAHRAIDVTNDGEVELQPHGLLQWTIVGPDAGQFRIDAGTESDSGTDSGTCSYHRGLAPNFAPGRSCHFAIEFHPTSPGQKQATLHVESTFGAPLAQDFAIRGSAIAASPGITVDTTELYLHTGFGGRVLITNATTTSVDLGTPVVDGPFSFSSWNCPSPLTPGGACTATILYPSGGSTAGCPIGRFTTTTSAVSVPLSARGVPSTISVYLQSPGSVRIDPLGMTCTLGQPCYVTLPTPTALTLTAMPETGGHFLRWSSEATICGTDPVCNLPAGATNVQLFPSFISGAGKTIAVTIVGTGTVQSADQTCTSSCAIYVEPGPVMLTESTTGTFIGWSGDCTGTDSSCELGTVINDRAVTATFSP